jgi:hypothetical protein
MRCPAETGQETAMTPTLSPTSSIQRRPRRPNADASSRAGRALARQSPLQEHRLLGRYTDQQGRRREVVAQAALAGSVLVVDRRAASHADSRLVAHLGADEPSENAALICEHYLQQARIGCCRCRRLTSEDSLTQPFTDDRNVRSPGRPDAALQDRAGGCFRLELLRTGMSIPELRWRHHPPEPQEAPRPVSVREVVARMEDYEPVRAMTVTALARCCDEANVSSTVLRAEMERVNGSPIVLNRGLRMVALATMEHQGLSLSEIAIRCGRVKHDHRGNVSGETSWLARRLGILPEGGRDAPTPWIHSDVLALIARDGLGVSPREVEL